MRLIQLWNRKTTVVLLSSPMNVKHSNCAVYSVHCTLYAEPFQYIKFFKLQKFLCLQHQIDIRLIECYLPIKGVERNNSRGGGGHVTIHFRLGVNHSNTLSVYLQGEEKSVFWYSNSAKNPRNSSLSQNLKFRKAKICIYTYSIKF